MALFQFNPTIRQTNRYLRKVVDDLTSKHGGVSNEEFERELVATTGIGWKQAKSYLNNPKPSQRIKDNAIILKFVRARQGADTFRKYTRLSVAVAIAVTATCGIYFYATKPNPIEQFVVHEVPPIAPYKTENIATKVFIEIPSHGWTLRVGPLKHSKIPLEKFVCTKLPTMGLKNCSLNTADKGGLLQVTVLIDDDMVRKFTVMTFNPENIRAFRKQLGARVDERLSREPASTGLIQEQFKVDQESVQVSSSAPGAGSRAMITIVVSM